MNKWLAAVIVQLLCAQAWAYQCQRAASAAGSDAGSSLSWFSRELEFTFFEAGTVDTAGNIEFAPIRSSFAAWENTTLCAGITQSDITILETASLSSVDRIGYNFISPSKNENLIIFRDDKWPFADQSGLVIGLTTATYSPLTGEIFDADIEFNAADFAFSADASLEIQNCSTPPIDCDCNGAPQNACTIPPMDIANVATHEIGHYLGLGHEDDIAGATMASEGRPREVEKRTLACDDREAIVFKYPSASPNGYCDPTPSCGDCAPPGELTRDPTISVSDSDDGMGGCGCQGSETALGALVAAAVLIIRRGRKKIPTR